MNLTYAALIYDSMFPLFLMCFNLLGFNCIVVPLLNAVSVADGTQYRYNIYTLCVFSPLYFNMVHVMLFASLIH
jgi:hypothetical protein